MRGLPVLSFLQRHFRSSKLSPEVSPILQRLISTSQEPKSNNSKSKNVKTTATNVNLLFKPSSLSSLQRTLVSRFQSASSASLPPSIQKTVQYLTLIRNNFNSVYHDKVATTRYGRLMRLDKPIGTHLLFLPCAWSIGLEAPSALELVHLTAVFYGGAVLLRGAGCTINDIWDADIDRKVTRTKSRPIAAGEISMFSAFAFLGAQFMGGLVVLTQLNTPSFLVAALSVPLLLSYPHAKRITQYPQAVLGLAMNWGALLGCTAASGSISTAAVWLYAGGWCWTMVYDTIYAFQDRSDDKKLTLKSTALTFGTEQDAKPAMLALTAAKLACLQGAGLAADLSFPYFAGVTASSIHLARQIAVTDLSDPGQCLRGFVNNRYTGAMVWAAIISSRLI